MPARAVPVDWEVATGPRMVDVVARGRVVAAPATGHAVHLEVDGLAPGRHYWYRFRAGGHISRLGRTKTCADPGAPLERLALAEPTDLAGYRVRHALYKTDPDLQAAHARHPFVTAWDDHEVENDYAGRHPVEGGDPDAFLRRRAAAYRAYWEHLPLRRPPRGASMPLYRRLRFGDLVDVNMLDTRQYRDDQPCDAGGGGGGGVVTCPERVDPRRTILGDRQRRWLLRGRTARPRAGTCSPSRWSWPSWTCTRARAAPGGATPGTGTPPTGSASCARCGSDSPPTRSCSPATSTRSSSTTCGWSTP
jgi:alkaline phosphatase D